MTNEHLISRRQAIKIGAMGLIGAAWSGNALASVARNATDKRLCFFNTHTGETLDTLYGCAGSYQPSSVTKINYILRDHRCNEIKEIDPRLLDLLHGLNGELGTQAPFHVISGYRSPATNAMLRAKGGANTGVASHSLHMDGKAVDIRVPGVPLKTLHQVAQDMRGGGVGYYPDLDFVHVDVGRVRYW